MLNKIGLKYRRYTSRRPLRRRAYALPSSFAALEALPASKQETGAKMVGKARSDSHGEEAVSSRREEALKVVKKALRARKNAEKVKIANSVRDTNTIESCSEMETTLREANENLVVASVNAHMMTEAVRGTELLLAAAQGEVGLWVQLSSTGVYEIGRAHV